MRFYPMMLALAWISLLLMRPLPLACVEPDLAAVRLHLPQGEVAAESQWLGEVPTLSDGRIGVGVTDDTVVGRDLHTGLVVWQAHDPEHRTLDPLTLAPGPLPGQQYLLLRRLPRRAADGKGWDFHGCGEVVRLSMATGAWATPLSDAVVDSAADAADARLVCSAVVAGDTMLIGRQRWRTVDGHDFCADLEVAATRLPGPAWVRRWPCAPPVPGPGAFLLSGGVAPVATQEALRPCTLSGDLVLICPGPTSPLYAIALADGKDRWSIDRLWEFERDFIGPSVWGHTMRRFGRDVTREAFRRAGTKTINGTPEDQVLVDAQIPGVIDDWRKDFDAHACAWLCGGPWVVPRPVGHGKQTSNAILLNVAIGPNHGFVRNLARERLFDLNDRGEVLALGDLPRPMLSAATRATHGVLAFVNISAGVGAFRPFPFSSEQLGMGGGSPDCLLQLAWYQELAAKPTDAWLQGRWHPRAVLSDDFAVQALDGGVVQNQPDTVLSTSLDCTTLASGTHERWTLNIPLTEPLKLPAENYSRFTRANGSTGTISVGLPVETAALTSMRILGERLVLTLGADESSNHARRVLVFPLPKRP